MADLIYPGGAGITLRSAAELISGDMSFLGCVSGPIAYQTNYSDIEEAVHSSSPVLFDNVVYNPKTADVTAITIEAGGQFTLADGTIKTFTATDVDIDTDWTTDNSCANGWASVWSNGTTTKFSTNASSCPSDVSGGVRIRGGVNVYTDGSFKIRQFTFDGYIYRYNEEIQVFSGTSPTALSSLDLSYYCPDNTAEGEFRITSSSYDAVSDSKLYFSLDNTTSLPVHHAQFFYSTNNKCIFNGIFSTAIRQTTYWKTSYAHTSTVLYFHTFKIRG